MGYDGKGKLREAIASLYGFSPKSTATLAELIGQAKDALAITSKAKPLPDSDNLAIYRWHVERRNADTAMQTDIVGEPLDGKPLTQAEPLADVVGVQVPPLVEGADSEATPEPDTDTFAPAIGIMTDPGGQPEPPTVGLVQNVKQVAQPTDDTADGADTPSDGSGILLSGEAVQDVKQDDAVYDVKQALPTGGDTGTGPDDYAQVHFALTVTQSGKAKRTTVMLEGYLVKALQRKHGLTDNAAISAWIGQAIKADSGRFDGNAPLTKQVKRIIVESFV